MTFSNLVNEFATLLGMDQFNLQWAVEMIHVLNLIHI